MNSGGERVLHDCVQLLSAASLALVLLACSQGTAKPGVASMDCQGTCQCPSGQACAYACGAGCMGIECLGGTCSAECAGGGCNLDCDQGGHCDYACSGGGCVGDCDLGATCNYDCKAGGCDIVCDEGTTCSVDCNGAAQPCLVTCENGGKATCSGNCKLMNCP